MQAVFLVADTFHNTVKVVEGTIDHAHHLSGLEQHLRPRLVHTLFDAAQDLVGLLVGDRRGLLRRAADEAEHLGDIAHQMPGLLVHLHLHQHVAGIELAFALALLAVAHLDDFLRGHQDLAEATLEPGALDALLERLRHPVLEVRIGVHHVPPERHQLPCPVISFVAQASPRSSNQKNIPATTTKMNTTSVVMPVSWRFGQTILRNSTRASSTNWRNSRPERGNASTSAASAGPPATGVQRSQAGRPAST